MKKTIYEAISGGALTPSESAPIIKLDSNPVVKAIQEIIKKDKTLKDVELVRIQEDGEIYQLDLRFEIGPAQHAQYAREEAKHRSYDIKRKLEVDLTAAFNIPSFSIAGVRVVTGEKVDVCEFEISFIYANKGNIKPTNESIEKDIRVRSLVETALKVKEKAVNTDPLKEALEMEEIFSPSDAMKYKAGEEVKVQGNGGKIATGIVTSVGTVGYGVKIGGRVYPIKADQIIDAPAMAEPMMAESDSQFPIREDQATGTGIFINGKAVDLKTIYVQGVDMKDYPDFCDAYVESAEFEDGTPLTDLEIEEFNDKHSDIVSEKAHESLHEAAKQKRNEALDLLERMGEIKREEKE